MISFFLHSLFASHLCNYLGDCDTKLPDILLTHQASLHLINVLAKSKSTDILYNPVDILQQYFLIAVPSNIMRYCTAQVLLHRPWGYTIY